MNERTFGGDAARLLSPQRLQWLEPERVSDHCLEGIISALDVGCGVGLFTGIFQSRGISPLAGIDIRADLLSLARQRVEGVDFRVASADQLPFGADEFDLVFLSHVLHEVDDPAQTLREAARVARQRIAVLEWPFLSEENGPPLEHRLSAEAIATASASAGLNPPQQYPLQRMTLYLWNLPS